jgi:hypothetical protein
MPGDGRGRRIGRRKRQIAVRDMRLNDGDDLVGIDLEVLLADVVVGAGERVGMRCGGSAVP